MRAVVAPVAASSAIAIVVAALSAGLVTGAAPPTTTGLPTVILLPTPTTVGATTTPPQSSTSTSTPVATNALPMPQICGEPTGESLFASLDDFVGRLNRAGGILDESGWPELTSAQLAVQPGEQIVAEVFQGADIFDGADVFSGPLNDEVLVGAALDPASGAVEAVLVWGDPDGQTTATAALAVSALCGDPSTAAPFFESFRSVARSSDLEAGLYVVQGANGFAVTKTAGAQPGDDLVSVVVAPDRYQPDLALVRARLLTVAAARVALEAIDATAPTAPTASAVPTAPAVPTASASQVPSTQASTSPAAAGAFFASLDDLVVRWNEASTGPATIVDQEPLIIAASQFASTPMGTLTAFGARIDESAVLGGRIDPTTGAVDQVLVIVDPDGSAANLAMVTAASLTLGSAMGDAMTAYVELAENPVAGSTTYVVSGANDIVLTVVEGAVAGDVLIAVAIAALTDERTANANADQLAAGVSVAAEVAARE